MYRVRNTFLCIFILVSVLFSALQVLSADNYSIGERGVILRSDELGSGVEIPGVKIVLGSAATDSGYIGNVGDKIKTVSYNYIWQIAEGNISGHSSVEISGHNLSVGLTNEEISALGTLGFGNWATSAAGVVLISTSAADDVAGTGALTVKVTGLDSNYLEVSETVTLTGLIATSATTQTFLRINKLLVVTAGSGLTNAGKITASISGTDITAIDISNSVERSRRTVPAGNTDYLVSPWGSTVNGKDTTFHIYTRDNVVANSPFVLRAIWSTKDNGFAPTGVFPIKITEKTDIVFIAHCEVDGGVVSTGIKGWSE